MRQRIFRLGLIVMLAAGSLGAVAFATLAGAHRALAPGTYGVTEIAPGVWIDDVAQAEAALQALAEGQARIAPFWGETIVVPRLILCTRQACADRFGLRPVAQAYGAHLVIVGPRGVNATILAHELSHIALHRLMGPRDIFAPRYPMWFNEGLAGYLSQDARYLRPADPRDADWVRAAQGFRDWGGIVRRHGWREAYGAAAALVAEMEGEIGRDGLRALIDRVAAGEAFEDALAALRR